MGRLDRISASEYTLCKLNERLQRRIMKHPIRRAFIGLRVSEEEADKVAALATRTKRSRSAVIRTLLEQAELANSPDIRLATNQTQEEQHE